MLIESGPGDTNTDDNSYIIMFLIRRNGICLPDECSWVSLQGRQFGEKGSPFQLLTHQINIQLRSTFIHCHWKCCFLTALIWEFLQSGVKAKSLVAQALTNTNSNIFNVSLSLVTTRWKWSRDMKMSFCKFKKNQKAKMFPDCRSWRQWPSLCPPTAETSQNPVKDSPCAPSTSHHHWGTSALSGGRAGTFR